MPLNFDLGSDSAPLLSENDASQSIFKRALVQCNTRWFNTSWTGLVLYITMCCINYLIGYYGVYRALGWTKTDHKHIRIFGDLVTVGWFSLGFVALPWHHWERGTCIETRDCGGVLRFMLWWAGTIITFFVYGYMGQDPFFQTSLASDLTQAQKASYAVVFAVIGCIILYWLAKLCPTKRCKGACNSRTSRKVIFIRLLILLGLLFFISSTLCAADSTCVLHWHHWWFGFCLIMLSTASLDNWFDYFLQGIFWTFLIESIFNYGLTFGEFFI